MFILKNRRIFDNSLSGMDSHASGFSTQSLFARASFPDFSVKWQLFLVCLIIYILFAWD